jgi:hypothetical protein
VHAGQVAEGRFGTGRHDRARDRLSGRRDDQVVGTAWLPRTADVGREAGVDAGSVSGVVLHGDQRKHAVDELVALVAVGIVRARSVSLR